MDSFDQKILNALQVNARQSVSTIAEQVNLSRSAVSERIKRMEQKGEILGYRVVTPTVEDSHLIKSYLEIRQSNLQCDSIAQVLREYNEVKHCHGTSGESDILAYLETSSMQRLQEIRQELDKRLPGNIKVITHMVMQEW